MSIGRTRDAFTLGQLTRWICLVLPVVLAWSCTRNTDPPGPRPNIILITIDTLRADHLGCYGYPRPSSPFIDRLAESGLLFERALSAAPWTLPSMATLHTSLYPTEHGAIRAGTPLPEDVSTLAETLREVGYDTLAFVSHNFVGRRYGFARGFRTFDESLVLDGGAVVEAVTSDELTTIALDALREHGREPFFLWIHYFDPHDTFVRHPEFDFVEADPSPDRLSNAELFAATPALRSESIPNPFSIQTVRDIYDEEIGFTDAAIGRLLDGIEGLALDRPIVTAFTADHGEYFMERSRFGHGKDVYDELIHVPLVISGDIDVTLQGRRFSDVVEMASLARTIAELGQVPENSFQGEDLLAVSVLGRRAAFSYGCYAWGADRRKLMVELDGWKLIENLDDNRFELYDLDQDPSELENLWADEIGRAGAMREVLCAALDEFMERRMAQAPSIDLSPEEIETLQSLGYLR